MADKSIRAISPTIDAMSADWEMVDDLMAGTEGMRKAGKKWLPKFPSEDDDSYKRRLETAVLHPVFKRTVLVNASRPFSKPITLGKETPADIQEWIKDIDFEGTEFAAFCVQRMAECLSKGLTGVLVDFPKADGIRTQAEERSSGVRPYCVHYPPNSILGWKTEKASDGKQFSQLRLLEHIDIDDGAFGTKTVEQVRLLTPGTWSTYRENKDNAEIWDLIESGVTSLNFVPFVFFYGIRNGFGIGNSPLQDLAYQNVEHWQTASDQQTILHIARVPILFARGLGEGGKLVIGANSLIQSDSADAELKYVEHTGAAIEAGKESIDALEERMRAAGAELISLQVGYATATEVSSDNEATKSLMQQICENFEESLQLCLDYMAEYKGGEKVEEIEVYKDFGIGSSDPASLGSAVGTGTISKQTHFEELQRRDIVSHDRTWEDEKVRLNGENTQAADQAAEAAAKLAKATPKPVI